MNCFLARISRIELAGKALQFDVKKITKYRKKTPANKAVGADD